tara:strand:- start:692 stop:2158 length:1467 start_codon:yes stop_codon:yes gene_type:complete
MTIGEKLLLTNRYINTFKFCTQLADKIARKELNNQTGRWMKDQLVILGPTYVKLGQVISSRNDLFPDYITTELSELQNNVPGFEFSQVSEIFETETNDPLTTYFDHVEPKPIAAASIGQVHLATLKSNQKKVIIKVQRPNIQLQFEKDVLILNDLINLANFINSKTLNDIVSVIDETIQSLRKEFNFKNETENILIFNKLLYNNEEIISPRVYKKLSTEKIIVMEYIPGIKINNTKVLKKYKIDTNDLAYKLVTNFVNILLKNGYVHSDPHPGNISVTKSGKLILYDYGIVSKVNLKIKDALKSLCLSFYDKDIEKIMDTLLKSGIINALETNAKNISDLNDYEYVTFYKIVGYLLDYAEKVDVNQLNQQLTFDNSIDIYDIPFVLNREVMILFKTLTTLEGVCKQLNPNFTYMDIFNYIAVEYLDIDFVLDKGRKDFANMFKKNETKKIDLDKLYGMKLRNVEKSVEGNNKMIRMVIVIIIFKTIVF